MDLNSIKDDIFYSFYPQIKSLKTVEKSIKNRTRKQSQGVDLASREQSKQNRETMKLREFSILT